MWEAQFGDFVNGAQVIIDQYVVAAEDKWGQRNGLVMLLPHGYEGQGPEHSSARIERFLMPGGGGQYATGNATTAAQYFHLLRRQVHSERRTPLVVFTPKQGLRMRQTRSLVDELAAGSFEEVLDDPGVTDRRGGAPSGVLQRQGGVGRVGRARRTRCAGRVVRVEQLYPLPREQMLEVLRDAIPTPRRSCGCRRSRRTWAPGTSSSTTPGG